MTKERNCGQKCRQILNWFFQIYIIFSIFFLLFSLIISKDLFEAAAVNLGVSYFFYIIMCFCSPTFSFLINRLKSKDIHNHMQDLYYTKPEYNLYCNSYHYHTHSTPQKTKMEILNIIQGLKR